MAGRRNNAPPKDSARELREARAQQAATAAILKVIARSRGDAQPVFNAIAKSAARLCDASYCIVFRFDGKLFHVAADGGDSPRTLDVIRAAYPSAPGKQSVAARAILERRIISIADAWKQRKYPLLMKRARAIGYRSMLAVPMMKDGSAIGSINLARNEVNPFTEAQTALLKTFADQAVIAIENVRLFKELQSRTEALTKSVGQLTALGEVGQAISSTLELETVLKTIVQHAVKLTGLDGGSIYEYDEATTQFALQAAENMKEELVRAVRETPVRKGEGAIGRCAETLEPEQIADIADDSYRGRRKELLIRAGYRSILAVPLLREDHMLGALQVFRKSPGAFAPEAVELLKTFATQSAMAIRNACLFREIAEKGKQLEVASQHKSSSSPA